MCAYLHVSLGHGHCSTPVSMMWIVGMFTQIVTVIIRRGDGKACLQSGWRCWQTFVVMRTGISNLMWKIPLHQNPDTDITNTTSTQETDSELFKESFIINTDHFHMLLFMFSCYTQTQAQTSAELIKHSIKILTYYIHIYKYLYYAHQGLYYFWSTMKCCKNNYNLK